MKTFKNVVLNGYNGKPINAVINAEGRTEDVTVEMALRIILNNAPLKTMNDSIQGMRLMLALDKAKEKGEDVVMEEGVHDWLKPIAEQLCPQIFRINGSLVYEHIRDGFEKSR